MGGKDDRPSKVVPGAGARRREAWWNQHFRDFNIPQNAEGGGNAKEKSKKTRRLGRSEDGRATEVPRASVRVSESRKELKYTVRRPLWAKKAASEAAKGGVS
ncbi:hypothetical protein FB451DRAFT_1177798 [Mycena latifolia]|nr:hypothetical protein FB451DRAFT_1177798 [Mycena latifolia]